MYVIYIRGDCYTKTGWDQMKPFHRDMKWWWNLTVAALAGDARLVMVYGQNLAAAPYVPPDCSSGKENWWCKWMHEQVTKKSVFGSLPCHLSCLKQHEAAKVSLLCPWIIWWPWVFPSLTFSQIQILCKSYGVHKELGVRNMPPQMALGFGPCAKRINVVLIHTSKLFWSILMTGFTWGDPKLRFLTILLDHFWFD